MTFQLDYYCKTINDDDERNNECSKTCPTNNNNWIDYIAFVHHKWWKIIILFIFLSENRINDNNNHHHHNIVINRMNACACLNSISINSSTATCIMDSYRISVCVIELIIWNVLALANEILDMIIINTILLRSN